MTYYLHRKYDLSSDDSILLRMANPYHVQLLNDLHHHFPEVLYNHVRFQSVPELLGYVNDVVRSNPQHQAYHYYHQQYHARYHTPNLYNEIMDDALFVPPPMYPQPVYRGVRDANPYIDAIRSIPPIPSPRSAPPPRGAPAPPSSREDAQQEPDPVVPSEPPVRFRSFISLGSVNLSTFLNQLLQDSLPDNLDDLEDVSIIPTDEQLRNNTAVRRLEQNHGDNCAICQDQMIATQDVRIITHCQHMFHLQCIDTWFQRHIQCPCCRHDIRDQ
jgi:hypothetical protein